MHGYNHEDYFYYASSTFRILNKSECCEVFQEGHNHCQRFPSVDLTHKISCTSVGTVTFNRGQCSVFSVKNNLVCEIRRVCENMHN